MYVDRRLGGIIRYRLSGESLMRVPEEIRESVVFMGYRDSAGNPRLAGTAFFIGSQLSDLGEPDHGAVYLVTAHHVVDKIREKGGRGLIRFDHEGAATWFDISPDIFYSHPDHPKDQCVDVALAPLGLPPVNYRVVPSTLFLTDEIIEKYGVGVGDEVFVSGLFWNHHGKKRNLPIIRIGNIAGMPEEKIATEFGDVDGYLVESRSVGGLSGSPVFVHLGLTRSLGGDVRIAKNTDYGLFYLLGVMQGHFANDELTVADGTAESDALRKERVNMGIAIVTPIEKVMEIMKRPEIKKNREEVANQAKQAREELKGVSDSIPDDIPEFSRSDFEQALKKVSRKLSDEEKSQT